MLNRIRSLFKSSADRSVAAFAGLALGIMLTGALAQGIVGVFQNGVIGGPSITGISDATSGFYFGTNRVGFQGHLESAARPVGTGVANTPVVSACGTTPTLATGSSDTAGTITMGTTATGCVITFGTAYTAAPGCTVTWRATPLASQSYTITAGALTLTQTSTSNNLADYVCVAKSGG